MSHKFQGSILVKGKVQLPAESTDRVAIVDASGELSSSIITRTELEYLDGVSGNLQTQLNQNASDLSDHEALSSGVHGVSGSVVGTSDSQSLTNKTIDADSNTISNIDDGNIKVGAAIDAAKIADGSISNTEYQYLNGASGNLQVQLNSLSDEIATKQDDVITTEGDLVIGNVSGDPVRLPLGDEGQVLTVSGSTAVWDTPTTTDERVKVSANDTTAKYLEDALVTPASGGLSLQTLNDGGDEDLQVSLDLPGMVPTISADDADLVLIYDDSEAEHRSQSRGDFLSGVARSSAGDLPEDSFSTANNQSSPANVTGFAFANAEVRSFKALASVEIDADDDLFEVFDIQAIQKGSSWDLAAVSTGDNSGIIFSITAGGQVQYTSTNVSGFASGLIKFRAITTSV